MSAGAFTLFQRGILRLLDGTIDLDSHSLKAVLTTSAQALSGGFTGASGDCRYADLTAELATANGYTAGGVALTGVSLAIAGSYVKFTANPISWSLTNSITFKYLAIYDDTAANKNLLCFVDMDTGGGSVSPGAGPLSVTPDANGIIRAI